MAAPILYYWAPCATCSVVVNYAEEHGIELDKRDIEQEEPYAELLALGGVGDNIPYLYAEDRLIEGNDACIEYLSQAFAG